MLSLALCVLITREEGGGYSDIEHSYPGSRETSAQPLGDRQETNMPNRDRRKMVKGTRKGEGSWWSAEHTKKPLEVVSLKYWLLDSIHSYMFLLVFL